MSLPSAFLTRLQTIIPNDDLQSVLASFVHKRTSAFRINPLRTTREAVISLLNESSIPVFQLSWYPDAFVLKHETDEERMPEELYKNGFIYKQNPSSILASFVLDPQPNEKILDMAAAPGSKTTHIAARMKDSGEIVANDISRDRLYKLKNILTTYGVTNAKLFLSPGQSLWKKYPEHFDRVLVDAPCSMEGIFVDEKENTYDHWSEKKVKELAKRQQYLLRSAVSATKVNGTIVYTTCTLSPEENEGVIDWILEKDKGIIEIESITLAKDILTYPAVTEWKNKKFNEEVKKVVRIRPTQMMEGFFIAKFKKVKSSFPAFWED